VIFFLCISFQLPYVFAWITINCNKL